MTSVQDLPRGHRPPTCTCSHDEPSSRHSGDAIRDHHADCCTFVEISLRAGADATRLAGACHRHDCRFEDMLGCPASCMAADPDAIPHPRANGTADR
ncbi:hypothetical protein GCM10023320_68810 [Pseudonocardia adelaidensis]|uniref:Uncharacterized protein n=1 Tax=Pseudonocardia adelaidensis TaxID=648754 RepID=A0ABP9P390_9PSEU